MSEEEKVIPIKENLETPKSSGRENLQKAAEGVADVSEGIDKIYDSGVLIFDKLKKFWNKVF